jgi:hypothetical protein
MSERTPDLHGKDIMDSLYAKFDDSKIKHKPGKIKGTFYDFIPASEIIDRLNKVFGYMWSVEEKESVVIDNVVLKRVRITIRDSDGIEWYKEQWGGSVIFNSSDLPDAFKGAFSKALAKAAAELGVALYLWGVEGEEDIPPAGYAPPVMENVPTPRPVVTPPLRSATPPPRPPQMFNPNTGSQPERPPAVTMAPMASRPAPPQSSGMTRGAGTSATAQIGIQTAPINNNTEDTPLRSGPRYVEPYQINAIKGLSNTAHREPLDIMKEVLGAEVTESNIQIVEDMTEDQATRVLALLRSIVP